jgi:hypothetical protein
MVNIKLTQNYPFLKGSNFSVMNYVYEHEFIKWIKSGGYGKVYQGNYAIFPLYLLN